MWKRIKKSESSTYQGWKLLSSSAKSWAGVPKGGTMEASLRFAGHGPLAPSGAGRKDAFCRNKTSTLRLRSRATA